MPSSRELREQVLDERGAGPIDHLEHQIESVGAPVVWVGYIEVPILIGVERSEEGEHGASITLGLEITEVTEIAAIHRKDVVEFIEVFGPHEPRTPPERDPVPHGDVGGARVGLLSLVPGACAGRVDADPVREPLLFQTVCQDPFSERRTADVAQAYKKY